MLQFRGQGQSFVHCHGPVRHPGGGVPVLRLTGAQVTTAWGLRRARKKGWGKECSSLQASPWGTPHLLTCAGGRPPGGRPPGGSLVPGL